MFGTTDYKRLVIAAYRLPFRFKKTREGYNAIQNSGGLVSAMLSLSESFSKKSDKKVTSKIVWAGVAGKSSDRLTGVTLNNEHFDIAPVMIPGRVNDLYYGGFCNDLIWPLFHYFPSYTVYRKDYFDAYTEANLRFRDEILKFIKPGDFIWIHDYQLFLLPEMLRKKVPDATIGFFLHIPFPSFEIFRLMPRPYREAIIKGILGSDLIGFHTNDYTQHFLKSVRRTTGYDVRQNVIYTQTRVIKADAFPIGIDFNKFYCACLTEKVISEKKKIRKYLAEFKLILSIDRLDYTKGLLLKLKGFERFIEKFPEWRSKVVFNMVVIPSRDSIEKYRDMKREIESMAGSINGKYSTLTWRPVIYQYRSLSFNEMIALYDVSDIGLITPLRDGMNLVAKEFISCQIENRGVLILSEMAGASSELSEALLINPNDTDEMSDSIFRALEMKDEEKRIRIKRMQKRLSSYNVFTWAKDFFDQASDIKKQQSVNSIRLITSTHQTKIITDYKKATRRILFLDYDGTLVPFAKYPEQAKINKKSLTTIKKLATDTKNTVVVISGRDRDFLENQFKGTDITLVAEHGYFVKKAGAQWEETVETASQWKESVIPILNEYVNRCNGTFVEEKTGSLAWHYRNADPDYAQLRLNELRYNLSEIIRNKTGFEIIEGNKVLEVKSGRYDKGFAAKSLIGQDHYDFVLAAGDDKTDEMLFNALPDADYTIRVGLTPTSAKYNISDYKLFLKLLGKFVEL
jgi:trehalose 6-phosphate synthase/phosphatase